MEHRRPEPNPSISDTGLFDIPAGQSGKAEAAVVPTAPDHCNERSSILSLPVKLETPDDLKQVIAQSSSRQRRRPNFDDLSMPNLSIQQPVFPTFTRFSSARFARADRADYKVVDAASLNGFGSSKVMHCMAYPVNLVIRDGNNNPLPELPPNGVPDSTGYPLFYSHQTHKTIKARSSGSLYTVPLVESFAELLGSVPDPNLVNIWQQMFRIDRAVEATKIVNDKILSPRHVDNHVALLIKAYLAYFDSIAAALEGSSISHDLLSLRPGTIINTKLSPDWPSQVFASKAELVYVCGGSRGYQQFWAFCCFDRPPIFATTSSSTDVYTTPFSSYETAGMPMVCVCDVSFDISKRPSYFTRPNLILSYIECYVQKFQLQSQANEALQIAMLWPCLLQTDGQVSLPRPLHTAEWLGQAVARSEDRKSPYQGLVSSNPYAVLASTLAAAWALQSQLYDYITLLTSERRSWKLSNDQEKLGLAAAWLTSVASAPGVGWDFLFRHQFHVTPSFFYLTGLAVEPVNWRQLLGRFAWKERRYPAHLRLIQPFWVSTSICCRLPWEDLWQPDIEISEDKGCLTASPSTIMRLLRLGIISPDSRYVNVRMAIFPLLAYEGRETVKVGKLPLLLLQTIIRYGVRSLATFAHSDGKRSDQIPAHRSPANSRHYTESWPVGGFLQHLAIRDKLPDASHADKVYHHPPGMANPKAVLAAESRLNKVKDELRRSAEAAAESGSLTLLDLGARYYHTSEAVDRQFEAEPVYFPQADKASGWWCILYLSRAKFGNQQSKACLVSGMSGILKNNASMPTEFGLEQMAGACAGLALNVSCIYSRTRSLTRVESAVGVQPILPAFMLRLTGNRWNVVSQVAFNPATERSSSVNFVDLQNMPDNYLPGATPAKAQVPTQNPRRGNDQELLYNLSTKVRLLDNAVQCWFNDLVSTDTTIGILETLFPGKGVPRFLKEGKMLEIDLAESRLKTAEEGGQSEAVALIQQYLTQQCGVSHNTVLREFKDTYARRADLCALAWPHRSPGTANKNNMSIVDLLSILDIATAPEALALWFIRKYQGNHSEFVTSVGLWLAGLNLCGSAWSLLLRSGLLEKNEDTWLDWSKSLHDNWRKNGLDSCRCSTCWTQLLYTQSLWGRGGVEVDWQHEISNKAKVPDDILAYTGHVWSAEYASQLIREAIREVLNTAAPMLLVNPFDNFMDDAYEWLVGGSPAGMPSAFKGTDIKAYLRKRYNIQLRPTKRSVMEAIPRGHILEQLKSRPQIIAKLHQKLNETGGKARAIYGVTIWHYIFSNWLMAPFEKAIRHPAIDINLSNEKFVEVQLRRAQQAHRGAYFSSYDYPDFNAMHTQYHMSMIYEEAAAITRTSRAFTTMNHSERGVVLQGYEWLKQSVFTQVCYFPELGEFIHTVGGLYSGNRDTTLINTLLNIAYAKVVDTSCKNMKFDPLIEWRLCHGDDIITLHRTYGAALGWNVVAEQANLKGQEKKLLTDRSYHEYLRVMGCPDGTLKGSLARVVATFVNGNWETDNTPGAYNKVVELQSSLAVLERRGMSRPFTKKLWRLSIERLVRGVSSGDADSEALKQAVLGILTIDDKVDSGRDPIDPGVTEAQRTEVYPENIRREQWDIERRFAELPAEVTEPYMGKLINTLPAQLRHQPLLRARLKASLQKSTYGLELPRWLQIETKQTPQLLGFREKQKQAISKRGKFERYIAIDDVGRHIREHKLFSSTVTKIKALYTLLSSLKDLHGYGKTQLIAFLCGAPEPIVRSALLADTILASDWRRIGRPSAPEVGALENNLEIWLTSASKLTADEEVVVVADDGLHNVVPVRNMMLY